jgi:glycolate oxidase FAD binding subunit
VIATAASVQEVQEAVRESGPDRRLLPVGGATKPALSSSNRQDVERLSLAGLSGVLEYDSAELTLTALAGTTVREVEAVLAEHDQHLPFDPPLVDAGATLGGVVAAGASGSGAWRHGGIRDFVIGVQFVDGTGHLISAGGRVVKNAAGFDLPKLMVGSVGRLGVMAQLSFKVFPTPAATLTLEFQLHQTERAVAAATALARQPVELAALDIGPGGRLLTRLGGRADTLDSRAARVAGTLGIAPIRHQAEREAALWREVRELEWVPAGATLVRVGLSIRSVPALEGELARISGADVRFAIGGTAAWISLPDGASLDDLDACLKRLGLAGMVLFGAPDRPLIGAASGGAFGARVTRALDPDSRFLEI